MKSKKNTKKVSKKVIKPTLDRGFTKIIPKVYTQMSYTPQELRLKFTQYLERSDKFNEEITISGFSVYASVHRDYLYEENESQELSDIKKQIMNVFEYRYEQKLAKSLNIPYLMNNRWKGKRETATKNESNIKVNKDISDALNDIMNGQNR